MGLHEWRTRHRGESNASFQPANAISNLTWGFAPGYEIAGLQPGTLDTIAAYPLSGRVVAASWWLFRHPFQSTQDSSEGVP
jgi:hypothetical protein